MMIISILSLIFLKIFKPFTDPLDDYLTFKMIIDEIIPMKRQ